MQLSEGYLPVGQGVRLFYQKLGDGPIAVVVANGLFLFADFERLASSERTLVFVDCRRGRSDLGSDERAFEGGIQRDVEDFEAIRQHFDFDKIALLGHSYCAVTVVSYALQFPQRVDRIVQLGPTPPVWGKQYPPELSCIDETYLRAMSGLQQLETQRAALPPEELCRRFVAILRPIYVVDPADVAKITWDPCAWPNEARFMKAWQEHIVPSLQRLDLDAAARVRSPVLTVAGKKDRSTPYGAGGSGPSYCRTRDC